MRYQLPEHTLVTLLRQCFVTPRCQGLQRARTLRLASRSLCTSSGVSIHSKTVGQRRGIHTHNGDPSSLQTPFSLIEPSNVLQNVLYTTSNGELPSSPAPRIAVLGGGITGLASAHYLTRELPHARITIYEGSHRLGGWVKSTRVETDEGHVVFEQGPRSLRPNTPASYVTIDMIQNLGLENEILTTSRQSVAALNRFIYYPDHLVKMPGPGQDPFAMVWSMLTESIFKGLLKGGLFEYAQPSRPANLEDESIGSFLERRLGSAEPGNNIVSAVLHGIYAGDIYKLSAKSLMPGIWHEEGVHGSIMRAKMENGRAGESTMPYKDVLLDQDLKLKINQSLRETMSHASVYTFKGGLGTFSDALEKSLRANPNVQFKMGYEVGSLEYDETANAVKLETTEKVAPQRYTHCISTLPARRLAMISCTTPTTHTLPALLAIPSVTVMVVNLFYRSPFLLPEAGFGYLIPRSISFSQNPECALGVVYDSYSSVGQDAAPGTKVTVMLGGHWWDAFDHYPSEEEGVEMAIAVLRRHLNITDVPDKMMVGLQEDCIPQYTVGHEMRLKSAHSQLMGAFKGKLSVAGNWVEGVGLNDCVRGARDLVLKLKGTAGAVDDATGLEDFQASRRWVQTKILRGVANANVQGRDVD